MGGMWREDSEWVFRKDTDGKWKSLPLKTAGWDVRNLNAETFSPLEQPAVDTEGEGEVLETLKNIVGEPGKTWGKEKVFLGGALNARSWGKRR